MNRQFRPTATAFAALSIVAGSLLLAACQDKVSAPISSANAATTAPAAAASPDTKGSAQDAYAAAAKGSGFAVGPMMAAHTVYVFFDPACPHCAHLWGEAKPLAAKLKIVWMPIGLLRSSSTPIGATILSAPDPVAAMGQNEAGVLTGGQGIAPNPSLPDGVLAKVRANTELFNKLGADSVPLIVFQNARTGQYGTHSGAMSTQELAAMAGI